MRPRLRAPRGRGSAKAAAAHRPDTAAINDERHALETLAGAAKRRSSGRRGAAAPILALPVDLAPHAGIQAARSTSRTG